MVEAPESRISEILSAVQNDFSDVDVGSYPQFKALDSQGGGWRVSVVLRGTDEARLEEAQSMLLDALEKHSIDAKFSLK